MNMDQISMSILPNSGYTFEKHRSEQVDIIVKDEKHAYKFFVASSVDGDFLPFQQVWSGATNHSVPSDSTSYGRGTQVRLWLHICKVWKE